jgi:hypothetical protein
MKDLAKYNKLWVALAGAVLTVLIDYFSDNQTVANLIPFLTAIGVYQVRNQVGAVSRKR